MVLKLILNNNVLQKFCYSTQNASRNKLYSNTVLLPKTKFPLRLENKKLCERDEYINNAADFENFYLWQRGHLSEPEFVLHDGPPYANGSPHMGHAINKILKDTIIRYQILKGNKVHYIPGWDCHGLPIELKALSNSDNLDPIKIRSKARDFADKTIENQKNIFKSWGVIGDWNKPYTTHSVDYVKNEFRQFFKLFNKNLVYRDVKPIYWSPSSKTALAEAELEYNENHKSPSAYVRLELKNIPKIDFLKDKRVYAIIWTTTPWTLPSNQAVCYNNSISYSLVKKPNIEDKDIYIIATELIENVSKVMNCCLQVLGVLSGEMLEDASYVHPIYKEKTCKFLNSSHATASKGTGLVHAAPAHGPDDFLVALSNKMPIVDLVNSEGCYRSSAGKDFEGKYVLTEGNKTVLDLLKKDLMHLEDFIHSYPYDWRTKQPVIIRASKQWFIDTNAIKGRAIELLDGVNIIPKSTSEIHKRNLLKQLEKRPYWCISRQRKWGVPIPVLYHRDTSEIVINGDLMNHYLALVDNHGTDFWWKLPLDQFIPKNLCSDLNIKDLVKGQDIFDIWFDSGISWSRVLEGNKVADMYLEGLDQFTGWFQSALITSVGLRDKVPYKTIYVHGFAVDEQGIKMSKSVGNVVDPVEIIKGGGGKKPYGVDALRWWVICHANQEALAHVSSNVLQSSADEVQKIRSVLRFALGSLSDYEKNEEYYNNLFLVDKYMLHLLWKFDKQVQESIDNYHFQKICTSVINLLTNDVSALYYTSVKDRLYCDPVDSISRRTVQFVLLKLFHIITQTIAPIVPHLAEEMYIHLPQKEGKTYFTSKHEPASKTWENEKVEKVMDFVLNVKKEINKQLGANTIDANIRINISDKIRNVFKDIITLEELEYQLTDIFQVSNVKISHNQLLKEEYVLEISKSVSFCCPRCRKINSVKENELCNRCSVVLNTFDNKTAAVN